MKRQIYRRLLIVIGGILLVGLIASCGEDSEPRIKVLESLAYTTATQETVASTLANKYLSGMAEVRDGTQEAIETKYWPDTESLIDAEMKKKSPSYGLMMIIKADNYRIRYRTYWTTKPDYAIRFIVYK